MGLYSDTVLLQQGSVLEKNVDYLPMAKSVFAINHLGIRRRYGCFSFRWHPGSLVVLSEGCDFCPFR